MIRLDTTTRKLQAVLAGAITTNNLPITVSYADKTSGDYAGATQLTNTNGVTAADICAAPAASTVRDVDYISVRNSDTVAAVVTIRYNDNATLYTIVTATLAVGDQLIYVHGQGWQVLSSIGAIKYSAGGDVAGPASATDGHFAVFDGTSGKLVKDFSMAPITNSLGADVNLSNIALFYDGPSVAQGTVGKWYASGRVVLLDSTAGANFNVKLWDGTTIIDSAVITQVGVSYICISLSGWINAPAGNLRISVQDTAYTTGKIIYNGSGLGKDSTITAIRIG